MARDEFYAHTDPAHPGKKPGEDGARWQLLKDHLAGVAERCRRFAEEVRPDDQAFVQSAYWAGLLHDLGKYRDEFQQYLRNERRASQETVHAVYGAAAGCYQYNSSPLAFAAAGHHTGLHDAADLGGTELRLAISLRSPSLEIVYHLVCLRLA